MATKIRLAIDATAVPKNLTGAGYYMSEIIPRLDNSSDISLFIVTRKNDHQRFKKLAPQSCIINSAPDYTPLRVTYQAFKLGALIDALNVDLFHGPHYQLPLKMKTPCVVTIHDMTFITHPEVHERKKSVLFSKIIPRSIQHAQHIIAISQHTANDIENICKTPREKMTVAPLGVNNSRFKVGSSSNTDMELLQKRGISQPYIAFLGLLEPRKCIPTLVEAFAKIAENYSDLQLVIAGADGWGVSKIREAIKQSGYPRRVILTGRLTDDEVPALLRQARAFIYPSMYEGFGMPVLEAMACGTPTITSISSSLAEVAGDAALLVEAQDSSALQQAIESILSTPKLHKQLSQQGTQRAKMFSWDTCAQQHIKAYQTTLNSL